MNHFLDRISIRFRLFVPLLAGIVLAVILAAVFLTRISLKTLDLEMEQSLRMEISTIVKMFERERDLKMNQVRTNLRVLNEMFYRNELDTEGPGIRKEIRNQIGFRAHTVTLSQWIYAGKPLQGSTEFVDRAQSLFGGTVTVFQLADSGFVRISTNVLQSDSSRALWTYIPLNSPVSRAVLDRQTYLGRAYVVNDWYVTAYEPIIREGRVIGMLYTGSKEKDLDALRAKISSIRIGKSGFIFVFDYSGTLLMHPESEGDGPAAAALIREILDRHREKGELKTGTAGGIILSKDPGGRGKMITAYRQFPDFNLYIAASAYPGIENRSMVRKNIRNAGLIGLIIILMLSAYIYFMAASRLHRYLLQVQESRQKLSSTRQALKQSEDRFRTLFNSAIDEIFLSGMDGKLAEVNPVAGHVLEYSGDEFAEKRMTDLASQRTRQAMERHFALVLENGKDTCEAELMSKDGLRIPVELKSRLMHIDEKPYFLSIARNITERKETERRILSAVIKAEERERERFARDMHDGLGPLLSTIKLFIDELRGEPDKDEKAGFINQSSELIDEAIRSIRVISNNLMPRTIHDYGLIRALEEFSEKIRSTGRIRIEIRNGMRDLKPDKNIELILFRVVTELINNTLKHSSADRVVIAFEPGEGNLLDVTYEDNGEGYSAEAALQGEEGGMGLKNISSRLASINGTMTISGEKGKGSKVRIRILI